VCSISFIGYHLSIGFHGVFYWNKVLRRIFDPKIEEVAEGWRQLRSGSFIFCEKMEAVCSSKTSVTIYQATQCHSQEVYVSL
jgi:hypothetical protein